jgi:hypothetical protein
MSVSSIAAPPVPIKAPDISPPQVADANTDNTDSSSAVQPPAQAALPPGQGTRVDQLA